MVRVSDVERRKVGAGPLTSAVLSAASHSQAFSCVAAGAPPSFNVRGPLASRVAVGFEFAMGNSLAKQRLYTQMIMS
jgi:hypothetical protein